MIKVYFNSSGRSDRSVTLLCEKIKNYLKSNEFRIILDLSQTSNISDFNTLTELELQQFYKSAVKAIKKSKIIILEVSLHSLTQGLLIEKSLQLNKPVIVLHRDNFKPAIIMGINNNLLQVVEYNEINLLSNLKISLAYAKESLESRFNFYLAPEVNNYLKTTAKKQKISRSALVRNILTQHMLTAS